MTRPILLLDVDGVLAPFALAPGYRPVDLGALGTLPLAVELNARRLARIAKLADIVWCTAREQDAVQVIGPAHDLPADLPFIFFGTVRVPGQPIVVPANPTGGSWKLPVVDRWVAEEAGARPVIWLDDDLGGDVHAWALDRTRSAAPTLCVDVDPHVGLNDSVCARVERIARDPERSAAVLSAGAEAVEDGRL